MAQALAGRLGVPVAHIEDGRPRRMEIDGDLALEYRWIAELPAVCLAVPLGQVPLANQTEVLVLAMSSNLYLADSGQPHFALCPLQETLYLCRTVSSDSQDPRALASTLDLLFTMAREARAHLRSQHGLA